MGRPGWGGRVSVAAVWNVCWCLVRQDGAVAEGPVQTVGVA